HGFGCRRVGADKFEKALIAMRPWSVPQLANGQVAQSPAPASNPPDPPAAESDPIGILKSNRAAIATGPSINATWVRAVRSPIAKVAEWMSNAVPPSSANVSAIWFRG